MFTITDESSVVVKNHNDKRNDGFCHMWLRQCLGTQDGLMTNADFYYGPLEPTVRKILQDAGWTPSAKVLTSVPSGFGPMFEGPVERQSFPAATEAVIDAMERIKGNQSRMRPAATTYATGLSSVRVPPDCYLTLRIETQGVLPCIFRVVRVAARMTLAQFHDFVICSCFGYTRCYHAYAFRRGAEPWLGPTTSSAMDMAHVPFYIGVLGDDHKVPIHALVSKESDVITYVHDLGTAENDNDHYW
jgi:hypothetical protein